MLSTEWGCAYVVTWPLLGEEAGSGGDHCRLGSGGRRPGVDAGLQGSETIRMDLP